MIKDKELIKKIITTSLLSISLFAGSINLETGVYEETPTCKNGTYNKVLNFFKGGEEDELASNEGQNQ